MSRHARTTISIPSDLKARMEAVSESVNWSALACQAFEDKLAEIIKRKGSSNMSDVVNRLRASKRKFENEQYQDGHAAGQSWAKEEAEAGELIRLEELHRHVDLAYFLYTDQDCKYSAAELLVFHVWPEYQGDRHAAGTFWERLGHQGQMDGPQDDFVRGFVDGAVSVWNDVRNQI